MASTPPAPRDSSGVPHFPSPQDPASLESSARIARRVVEEVADRVGKGGRVRVLGLTGPPGTGKSTVAALVADLLPKAGVPLAGMAPMDGFHMSNRVLAEAGIADHKGAPDTFDVGGFVALLERIQRAEATVLAPDYRRELHEPVAASLRVAPEGVAVTEGNYLGLDLPGWSQVRGLVDVLVYVDTPENEVLRRLVARHEAFGRDRAAAAHWVRTVDLANIRLVASTRPRADLVV